MNLFVRTVTLLEANGEPSPFPKRLRQLLCSVVEGIDAEAMPDLLSKRETDRGNFDGRIEAGLRELDPLLTIKANCLVSGRTRFDNDLVIDADEALVCVEIEKGCLSRFEFDILKMQAFASSRQLQHPGKPVFGAFVVPDDNLVARHISGNSRESSFRYLKRLCRLVAQVHPLHVEDILIVGYSLASPTDDAQDRRRKNRGLGKPAKAPGNLALQEKGLLPDDRLRSGLRGFAIDLVVALRSQLAAACPKLREKLNTNTRYLAYGLTDGSDALYVYVQKRAILIDVRVPADRADELRRRGFDLRPRDNYQAKAGWLTGLFVPHDTDKLSEVVSLALEALQED
jgi:hypothetical protein